MTRRAIAASVMVMTKVLALILIAWSAFAPFAGASVCAAPSCCAQMASCAGQCHCAPKQTCQVSKPPAIDQQFVDERAQVSPRVEVMLFTLHFSHAVAVRSPRTTLARVAESPPPGASSVSQVRLCLWLI